MTSQEKNLKFHSESEGPGPGPGGHVSLALVPVFQIMTGSFSQSAQNQLELDTDHQVRRGNLVARSKARCFEIGATSVLIRSTGGSVSRLTLSSLRNNLIQKSIENVVYKSGRLVTRAPDPIDWD